MVGVSRGWDARAHHSRSRRPVVKALNGKGVVMVGLKPKSTMHTIEDAKRAQDLRNIGLQMDLPFFHHPNQDDYVRFYTDLSEPIEIGIMVYNTYWFGVEPITPEKLIWAHELGAKGPVC